jgi:hypothetical protein
MPLLTDFDWQSKYDHDHGSLIEQFYLRARLSAVCSRRNAPCARSRGLAVIAELQVATTRNSEIAAMDSVE